MRISLYILVLFLLSSEGYAQAILCADADNQDVDLSNLSFPSCSGTLTYNIIGSSNGLDCINCGNTVGPVSSAESITVEAFSGANLCGSQSVSIVYLDANFTYSVEPAPDCNQFVFNATGSSSVVAFQWDFNGDGQVDASGQNVTWTFTNNGNQSVELTVLSGGGSCSFSTSQNVFIDGPWAELSLFGNPDGGTDFESLGVVEFNNDACTVPLCVDDVSNTHCIQLSEIPHPNANVNSSYEIYVDGTLIYSASTAPINEEHCYPSGFSGYSTVEYIISDNAGCVATKSYSVYIAEDVFPNANVTVNIPNTNGFCIGESVDYQIIADNSNPQDLMYIIAIDCLNQNFNQITNPAFIDTLYLDPGEVYTASWNVTSASCHCVPTGQYEIYTFMLSPCLDFPFPGGSGPFTVNLDAEAAFNSPESLCQNDSYTFNWLNAGSLGSGICSANISWTIMEPGSTTATEVGTSEQLTYQFLDTGTYTVCLDINSTCSGPMSMLCQDICIDNVIDDNSLNVTWPDLTSTYCIGQSISPSVFVDPPLCGDVTYVWNVSPTNADFTIDDNTSINPTISFNDKGDYTITVVANAPCGSGQQSSDVITVGAPPQIVVNQTQLGGCPDQPLCLDEAFCVDDCNANFTTATLTIYEGSTLPPNCDATSLVEEWSASGNPLISFPMDMQELSCTSSNSPCDFQWDVPSTANGDYVAVLFLENECGAIINCLEINISTTSEPTNDIPMSVCIGDEIDPNLTNFSTCEWSIGGSVVWVPGDGPITINSDVVIDVSCSGTGCPFVVTHNIDATPLPIVTISGALGICENGTTNLVANTTETMIEWYDQPCAAIAAGSVPIGINSSLIVSSTGTYAVQVTNAMGCKICEEVNVSLDQAPMLNCTNESYCENEASQIISVDCLLAPGGDWNGNEPTWDVFEGANLIANNIGPSYTVGQLITDYGLDINANTTFQFIYNWTSALGCDYTNLFEIEILNEGINNLNEDLCTGEEFEMDAGGPGTWSTLDFPTGTVYDITGAIFTWTPSITDVGGIYTLTFQPDAGCALDEISINVNLSPTVDISTVNNITNFCEGSSLSIDATAGFANYEWVDDVCGSGTIISGETLDSYDASVAGSYSVVVTDVNGCKACDEITVSSDPSPNLSCSDYQFCENELDETIDLTCLSSPPNGWGTNPVQWLNNLNGTTINGSVPNLYSVQDILNDLGSDLFVDTEFYIVYEWLSEAGCNYSDSISVTILNEGINEDVIDICSGEEIGITPDGSDGFWETSNFASSPDTTSIPSTFLWSTDLSDVGGVYNLDFISGAGCSSFEYAIEIHATPSGSIVPSLNEMCVENSVNLVLDQGTSMNQTLIFEHATDVVMLDPNNTTFSPSILGLNPENDGELIYSGTSDYPTTSGTLTCSFSDSVAITIIDYPESLFFPTNICEGEEFEPAVCTDPYIDSFDLFINGTNFNACPLDLGNLNGINTYDLSAFYGGTSNCIIDTSGTISIQEQLLVDFTSVMDSCSAEVEIDFNIVSGALNGIESSPAGDFTDDVINQTIFLPIDDVFQDQDFNYSFTVDDGGCDVLNFDFTGTYIGQINPAIIIEPGPYCSGQSIAFTLTQAGSSFVDSVIINPGNGDPSFTWIDDDYDESIAFVYTSLLDTSLMVISAELFNQCHDTLVVDSFIVDPPQLIAFMDPVYYNCPGTTLDLNPDILGNYDDYDIFVSTGLNLSLINASDPFVFEVAADQSAGIFEIEIVLEPFCGDPISVFADVEIYEQPNAQILADIQCSGQASIFTITNSSLMETYEWTIDGQTFLGDEAEFIFSDAGAYDIILETTNTNECVVNEQLNIVVGGVGQMSLFQPIEQCGDLDITLVAEDSPNLDVHWIITNDQNEDVVEYYEASQTVSFINSSDEISIVYSVLLEIVDTLGCETFSETSVEIFPHGSADIEQYSDSSWSQVLPSSLPINLGLFCSPTSILLRDGTASNTCGWTTTKHPCASNSGGFCPEFAICFDDDVDGWVYLNTTNPYGCQASDSLHFNVSCLEQLTIFIPNTFTPNEDGINDLFKPVINGDIIDYEFLIYDRHGQLVFASEQEDEFWNGSGRHNENYYVPNGLYNWILTVREVGTSDPVIKVGHVSVER